MKSKFLIEVSGTQIVNSERDVVDLTTTGDYMIKNGRNFIMYKEYDDEVPGGLLTTVVKAEGSSKVIISRNSDFKSRLILEKERRHQCHYATPFGELMVGVYTYEIENHLNENGGQLKVVYSLDFNSDQVSKNELIIKINRNEG